MASDWLDPALFASGQLVVADAIGQLLDGVETARETTDGVEVICFAITPDEQELLLSRDGGITFDPVRARMDIPGGTILNLSEE